MAKLLTTAELQAKIAESEAARAAAEKKAHAAAESEKQALLDRMTKPSGLSDDEIMEKASDIIARAVENNLNEVQIYRFPRTLCSDGGRAINMAEAGWEATLTGIPKELYLFWERQLKPRGYKIAYQTADYPGGMPGDIRVTLSWGA